MKTTLDLNDELVTRAKALAARRRTSLARVIEEALRLRLAEAESPASAEPAALPIHHGRGGLAPGLDGLSNKALRDAADDDA